MHDVIVQNVENILRELSGTVLGLFWRFKFYPDLFVSS